MVNNFHYPVEQLFNIAIVVLCLLVGVIGTGAVIAFIFRKLSDRRLRDFQLDDEFLDQKSETSLTDNASKNDP